MFNKTLGLAAFLSLLTVPTLALADDWTGQPSVAPLQGPGGTAVFGSGVTTAPAPLVCVPGGNAPPCGPGQHAIYDIVGGGTQIAGVPAGNNLAVNAVGFYPDPSSPTGVSVVGAYLPLSAFARSDTVDDLSSTVGGLGTTVDGLTTTVGGLGTTVNGLTTTVGGLSTSVGSLNNTVDGLSTTMNGLTTSVGSLNSTVGLLSGTVGTLSNTVNGLSASIGTINANLGALSTTVGGLNTTVNNLGTSFTALSSTVNNLQGTVNTLNANVGTLSTQLSSLSIRFDQFQQQVHMEEQTLREGVAMSLAMDGVGDLGPDEKVAISMNVGTYGGQNGVAAGVAFRAAEHLTFNGGIGTGFNRGLIGGRAGVRLAW